jgi:hypothetical protein
MNSLYQAFIDPSKPKPDSTYHKPIGLCKKCEVALSSAKTNETPAVLPSRIPGAGKGTYPAHFLSFKIGLFALQTYEKGDLITLYGGQVYASNPTHLQDTRYVLFRGGFYIDGKIEYGKDLGRWINDPVNTNQTPNCKFGHIKIGFTTPIEATETITLGQEILINYGPIRKQLKISKVCFRDFLLNSVSDTTPEELQPSTSIHISRCISSSFSRKCTLS